MVFIAYICIADIERIGLKTRITVGLVAIRDNTFFIVNFSLLLKMFKPKFHEQFFSMMVFICSCKWDHMTIFSMTSQLVQNLACQLLNKYTCHRIDCYMKNCSCK